jgi:hypothetical protein
MSSSGTGSGFSRRIARIVRIASNRLIFRSIRAHPFDPNLQRSAHCLGQRLHQAMIFEQATSRKDNDSTASSL